MQTPDFNSDARPLPPGWTQHFEPTKRLWYYVQTNVMPPNISFTHPLDMVPAIRSASPYHPPTNNTHMSQSQLAVSPMQTPQNPSQSGGGLTFAQQLYASSMSSLLDPMVDSHSVPRLPTSQPHIRNLPTPPPSSSPPPGTRVHFHNTPVNEMPSQSYQTLSHPMDRTPNFNSTPSSAPPFSNPHRTNTFQTPILPSNNSHPQRHRASTYDQGMSQHSTNVNPSVAGSRPTRHLVTMARPPDQQSSSGLSPLLLEPPVTVHSAPEIPSPLPASSILFLQATGLPLTSPLTPPLSIAQSTPGTPSNISSVFSVPSGTAYDPQSNISSLGRVASGSAIIGNGGVAQSLGGRSLTDGIVGVLQSVLLTPSTGVDHLSLQAAIQARPDADYQRIINALIKLHQRQHQQFSLMKLQVPQLPPAIDYQALITEVQRLRALAQAQQVTTAPQQQQLPQLQTSAQLQADQQQQQTAAQQYQALVRQRYQQQTAIQQQQQLQAAQYQALLQQQQVTTQAQQNQSLLHTYPRPPQQPQQSQDRPTAQAQSTVQTFIEAYKQFQLLNPLQGVGAGDTGGVQTQPSFEPTSLYSDNSGVGEFDFSQLFAGNRSQDLGGLSDLLSASFSQDNSAG